MDPCSSDLLHNVWIQSTVRLLSVWSDVSFAGGYKQRAKDSFYCSHMIYDYLYGPAKSIILFNDGKLCALSPILYYCSVRGAQRINLFFIMNSHHNKCVISLISEIHCTNLALLKWISSLRTYPRIHCKREHCKYTMCMNWKRVSLIRPSRWLALPVSLCHFAFDPFVTPIPPQPFVFIKKLWVSAQSELQRPLVGVEQTSSTRSTLHVWSPQMAADLQARLFGFCRASGDAAGSKTGGIQRNRGCECTQQDEQQDEKKIKVGELNTSTEGKTLFTTKEKYHIQLAKCLWPLITLNAACCSPIIRFTILAPSCEQAE